MQLCAGYTKDENLEDAAAENVASGEIFIIKTKEGQMKKNHIFLLAIYLAFVTGCATVPTEDLKVAAEADPKADFSGYKTLHLVVDSRDRV